MKVRNIFFVSCMVLTVLLFGCSAKQQQTAVSTPASNTPADASSVTDVSLQETAAPASTASKQLASLGFYIYEEPVDLPLTSVAKLEGGSMSADEFKGKITLLNFWATWCPPCRAEMPSIERLYAQTKNTAFQIVAVNSGEQQAQVASFIEKNKYTFPIYLDESQQVSSIFIARGMPATYIINKNGKVIAARIGAMEYDQPALIRVFKELADE